MVEHGINYIMLCNLVSRDGKIIICQSSVSIL